MFAGSTVKVKGAKITENAFIFLQSEGLMQSGGSEAENRKGHSENRCLNPPRKSNPFCGQSSSKCW